MMISPLFIFRVWQAFKLASCDTISRQLSFGPWFFACYWLIAVMFTVIMLSLSSISHELQTTRDWKVLCWNVRGLNSTARQNAVRGKIEHSQCAIICLQETKCETVDHNFIKSFCPRRFDQFSVVPLRGASGEF